ncbi:metallophosphoesterase [Alicyclobacillus ferrooxydans]|uniref:metallophosphoesterase n=1 Tax=Alicyclobacillus ferrooxydans TaxID=471514 RepID=UPI0006D5761B|nr:metallophosphoesterase [Alicyclobacillus ferrooxydans]
MVVLSGVLAVVAAFYVTSVLPTQWLDVQQVHLGLGIGKRMLQITDIHVEMLRISPSTVANTVRRNHVDYVMWTGDFLTTDRKLKRVERYLTAVAETGVPMYAVLGNHDYRLRRIDGLVSLLNQYGVTLLRNQAVEMDGFWLVGVDDFTTRHSRVKEAFAGVPVNAKVVVITHDPNVVLNIPPLHFDYLMAGHLHGKQFNVPGLYWLKPMGELPKLGVYKGLHQLPQGLIYISKGLGQVGINLRFLVRSELTVHHL